MKAFIIKVKKPTQHKNKFFLGVQAGAGTIYYELVLRPRHKIPNNVTGYKWTKEFNIPL